MGDKLSGGTFSSTDVLEVGAACVHSGSRCSVIILYVLDRLRARSIMFPFPSFSLDHDVRVSREMKDKLNARKLNLS